jgi:hypothetical protein
MTLDAAADGVAVNSSSDSFGHERGKANDGIIWTSMATAAVTATAVISLVGCVDLGSGYSSSGRRYQ